MSHFIFETGSKPSHNLVDPVFIPSFHCLILFVIDNIIRVWLTPHHTHPSLSSTSLKKNIWMRHKASWTLWMKWGGLDTASSSWRKSGPFYGRRSTWSFWFPSLIRYRDLIMSPTKLYIINKKLIVVCGSGKEKPWALGRAQQPFAIAPPFISRNLFHTCVGQLNST